MTSTASASTPVPWWRVRMVWLVIGGPLCVVVASIVTAAIALRGADDILTNGPAARQGDASQMPAVQARNHAATSSR